MSGYWSTEKGDHSHIQFKIRKAGTHSKIHTLYFDDTRRFGKLEICYSDKELEDKLKSVGTDLMNTAIQYFKFRQVKFAKKVQEEWLSYYLKMRKTGRSKNRAIFTLLMDQKYFSGIGCYIAAETLYKSKISPERKVANLSKKDIINLFNNAITIMYLSYKSNGVTIRDYQDPEGGKGVFKRLVYGHNKDPNGYSIIKTKFNNGRTCQWVKEIQV